MEIEKEEYKGLTIKIFQDEDSTDPRDWDHLGVMVCAHGRYNLGDEQINTQNYGNWSDVLQELLINERGAKVFMPLFLMDHSGLSISVGGFNDCDPQGWDWGQVGWIYMTQDVIDENFTKHPEWDSTPEQCLRAEVKEYDQYLTGDIYGFVVESQGTHLDSCWGFYGTEEAMKEAAQTFHKVTKPIFT